MMNIIKEIKVSKYRGLVTIFILKCKICNKEFSVDQSRITGYEIKIRNGQQFAGCFCSKECRGKHQKEIYSQNNIELNCPNCNGLFISKNYQNHKFCSQICNKIFSKGKPKPKRRRRIERICDNCYKSYDTIPSIKSRFCCIECSRSFTKPKKIFKCRQCNKEILLDNYEIKDRKFCSQSCSTTHRNINAPFSCNRSKLEIWLEDKLKQLYPKLDIKYNDKYVVNPLELDIYIPSLYLAFELNGIFHYEPIFGKQRLERQQNNDNNKFQKCIGKLISLCIIDTSSQKRFNDKSNQKFLNIITNIINNKLFETHST